ncbi:T9SS type A sorting domain-containing protein, partial [Olleya sp. AH-315-F22]|nr:T9SS type A sorting domain-containing protein [Olleya sp. AH-315-F22]
MKKNYLNQILLMCFVSTMAYSQQTVLIDFSDVVAAAPAGSYNTAISSLVGVDVIALINDTGASSGFTYQITDKFHTLSNNQGTAAPTGDAAIFDVAATRDNFFANDVLFSGETEPTGAFTITGLDDAKFYSFEVFASRLTGGGDNREALYTIVGANTVSGSLDPVDNTSNTVLINNVQSTGGVITFTVSKGTNNTNSTGFFYIGVLKMLETTTTLAINDFIIENGGLSLYPNPVENVLNIKYILKSTSKTSISIYDITGKLVYNANNGLNQPGTYNFK